MIVRAAHLPSAALAVAGGPGHRPGRAEGRTGHPSRSEGPPEGATHGEWAASALDYLRKYVRGRKRRHALTGPRADQVLWLLGHPDPEEWARGKRPPSNPHPKRILAARRFARDVRRRPAARRRSA